MKNKTLGIGLMLMASALLTITTGCASAHHNGKALAVVREYEQTTNKVGFLSQLLRKNPYSVLKKETIISDNWHGGGVALLDDTALASMNSAHINPTSTNLGGGHTVIASGLNNAVSTNAAGVIKSGGDAAGSIIGHIVNTIANPSK